MDYERGYAKWEVPAIIVSVLAGLALSATNIVKFTKETMLEKRLETNSVPVVSSDFSETYDRSRSFESYAIKPEENNFILDWRVSGSRYLH